MTTVLLIRHATNDYVKSGRLAGWTPDVHLNEEGQNQARALGLRLASMPLRAIYSSPLERTQETAQAIAQHHPALSVIIREDIGEVQYGDWTGLKISELTTRKMWRVIQEYPSRAYFPNGETMRDAQTRMVNAIEAIVQAHPGQIVALVSHADLIKMATAHYMGLHLDNFQRIVISPASITTLELGHSRPAVASVNDLAHLYDAEKQAKKESSHGTP